VTPGQVQIAADLTLGSSHLYDESTWR